MLSKMVSVRFKYIGNNGDGIRKKIHSKLKRSFCVSDITNFILKDILGFILSILPTFF